MSDKNKGLYSKFEVRRTDGSSEPGKKHHGCQYFVLDLTHDPFAVPAIEAYATACGRSYPVLADDLHKWLRKEIDRRAQRVVWVAERGEVSEPEYLTMDHEMFSWTKDIHAALQCSRRDDVERLVEGYDGFPRICEHIIG